MELDLAIGVISRWGSTSDNHSYVFGGNRDEINEYLHAVDKIQRFITAAAAPGLSREKTAIQIAMPRLADEMRNILKVNSKSTPNPDSAPYSSTMTDSSSNSYEHDYVYSNALSSEVIDDLRSIATRMNYAGYLQDCTKAYSSERKRNITASFQRLNIKKFSNHDAGKMEWKALKAIIEVWVKSAKICFRKIFPYEKQLCVQIFHDLGDDTHDACFLETVNDHATQLLDIASTLSCIPRASERLFGILELYKTLFGLRPEINKLFDTKSSESFRTKAAQILPELGDAVTKTLMGFEKDVLTADQSRHVPVDKIHNLSKYVMGYVWKLCQDKQTLTAFWLPKPTGAGMNFRIAEPRQPHQLAFHVIWIVMCLVSKLESVASSYKDASASSLFQMNNFHYILRIINEYQEVKAMIRGDCFEKVTEKFNQAKAEYLRLTFAKVMSSLSDKGSKRSLSRFNTEFEKLHSNLALLSVADFQLLQDLRVSMKEMLVTPYASFLGQLSSAPNLQNDVKYSSSELKLAVLDFFGKTRY